MLIRSFILTIAISLNCFTQHSCSNSTTGDWYYQMNGNLDDSTLSCRGIAHVSHFFNENHQENIKWVISKLRCTGYQEVDWLHDMGDSGRIYFSNNSWQLENSLPGLGSCNVEVTKSSNGDIQSVLIICDWKCRDPEYPCNGQAKYIFERKLEE